ncbi:MAG TPA: lysylphosphatidylglycerol synthase domain-containing protein [Thermoanaerobaculia bacterium]|nr:lysylphosphatidylglycerol synthase domain-containing protein [Thermoanaerobaculia bacterium]
MLLGALLLGALFALLLRALLNAPADTFAFLRRARAGPLAAGLAVYALAFAARGLRLQLLLPPEDRVPFTRAWSLSAAVTFLLQVVPFRGGELAGWAATKRTLGFGWARAGAVFALVKAIDSACLLLVGLGGASALAADAGRRVLSAAGVAAAALLALALLAAPWGGTAAARAARNRLPEGSRRKELAGEVAAGLDVVSRRPALYALALVLALAFLGGHLAALTLLLRAFGLSVPVAALAFASLTSVVVAGFVPSPAGSFGPMESGFAAGLAAAGVPMASGAVYGALLHLLTTAVAGILALPLLKRDSRARRATLI